MHIGQKEIEKVLIKNRFIESFNFGASIILLFILGLVFFIDSSNVFFFISGYLFDIDRYSNFKFFLKKRFKTLVIPYFIFAFLALIFVFLLQYFNISDSGYDFNGINSLIYPTTKILYSHDLGAFNGPIWFLTLLFIIEIYYYFLRKYIKNTRTLILFLLISSRFTVDDDNEISILFSILSQKKYILKVSIESSNSDFLISYIPNQFLPYLDICIFPGRNMCIPFNDILVADSLYPFFHSSFCLYSQFLTGLS